MSGKSFGWCFLGSGGITRRVLADLPQTDGGYLASVWSRNFENAEKLTAQHGGRAYVSMEQAITAPDVDAVYVATPHPAHQDCVLRALELGKPVLCEKPFALNAAQTRKMIETARSRRVYLMEAMWSRFNPAILKALSWAKEGRIGRVRSLEADFSGKGNPAVRRLYDPALGGGSLLDIGVYTVAFARFVFGCNPEQAQATAHLSTEGVDLQCAIQLRYGDGAVARLFSSLEFTSSQHATIWGDLGYIRMQPFWKPDTAELTTDEGTRIFNARKQGEGYQFEFDAAMEDIRQGRLENELYSLQDTLETMELLDLIRDQIHVRYPGE